ncbi:MAG: glycoside hydrolase family 92 protein [Ignavibacteriales bacterium]|nr:glycoside hydrolase family 92 protein [Ignavibacteriales bacterium]
MQRRLSLLFLILSVPLCLRSTEGGRKPSGFVNPFIGTDAHGHTFPGATLPFGMVQLSPDTRVEGWDACGGYHYSDHSILGFSHTHLSGTGIADYGDILLMPTTGKVLLTPGTVSNTQTGYRSGFTHESEKASPGFYSVHLDDYNIGAELTTMRRVGVHRYTFPQSTEANIIIDLKHGLGPDRVTDAVLEINGDREIAGFRRSNGWAKDQVVYFVARFSKPFTSAGVAVDDTIRKEVKRGQGTNIQGFVRFATSANERIVVKVGFSGVSIEGARKNLEAEAPGWDFDAVRMQAEETWNTELAKVDIEGGSREQRTTFYTALYHAMIAPNLFSDVDGSYRGMDGKTRRADGFEMYTVFSLWDTFRAEHPLLTLIDRKRTLDFVKSMLAKYDESGVLPVWELAANETWTMIGYHSIPVILDAYVKGVGGFDPERAFAAMKNSAMRDHFGLAAYRKHGGIPGEAESESVSKTLEYAYDDWCIAEMARLLGKKEEAEDFGERAQFYKNLFDPSTGFMRPRKNGAWLEPFDPRSVTVHFTEANAWQYTFFVPHHIDGLIGLMGGKRSFAMKLDSLFKGGSHLTGREQSDITGLIGQYAQGNEPSHNFAYLYNYADEPWKTQETVRLILDSLFHNRPDGLSGNDDCGQMSAWYVLSAMGFYPVTPGLPYYSLGSPLFDKVTIHLENGKEFVIRADQNSHRNKFIQSASLNSKSHTANFLNHDDLTQGGELRLVMGPAPNTSWAAGWNDAPRSRPLPEFVGVPVVAPPGSTFEESVRVSLTTLTPEAKVYYTLDGSSPSKQSTRYTGPLTLTATTTINAMATKAGTSSRVVTAEFLKTSRVGTISLHSLYSYQYTGGGDHALVDRLRGGPDFRLGAWQGYEGNDLEAVIDLGEKKQIANVSLGCLQDNNSWIFFPVEVEFALSEDGKDFHHAAVVKNPVPPQEAGAMVKEFSRNYEGATARFVRVRGKNVGTCPPWHKGAGGKAWLFADEISVEIRK